MEDASNTFGTLTLGAAGSAASASVVLFGQFAASGFSTSSDGGAGVSVTYTPAIATPPIAAPH